MKISSPTVKASPNRPRKTGPQKVLGAVALGVVGGAAVVGSEIGRRVARPLWTAVVGEPVAAENTTPSTAKAWGATGAAVGAALGRYLLAPAGTFALLQATTPLGVGANLALAGAITAATETVLRPGRLVGGSIGGTVGYLSGLVADRFGHQPEQSVGQTTAGFELSQLPRRLLVGHNSTPSLHHNPEARAALEGSRPGDILITHHASLQGLSSLTALAGRDASYTHVGLVGSNGKILHISDGPAEESEKESWLKYQHLAVLRPRYDGPQSIENTEGALRELAQKSSYNLALGILAERDPELQYCGKFVRQGLQIGAPEIHIEPSRWMGLEMALADDFRRSTDVEVVYDSGADFWHYHLRNFS